MRHVARGLIHTRKPQGSPGVTLRAVNDRKIEETIWFTELGVPAARVVVEGTKIYVLSGRGQLYQIGSDAVQKGVAEPVAAPSADDVGNYFGHSQRLNSGEILFFNQRLDVLAFKPASGQTQKRRIKGARGVVASEPQAMGAGLLVPLNSGQVMYVDANCQSLAHPFQPKLEAGGVVNWRRPAVVDKDKFVIADGRQTLYLVGVNKRGAAHLGVIEEKGLKNGHCLAAGGHRPHRLGRDPRPARRRTGELLVRRAVPRQDRAAQRASHVRPPGDRQRLVDRHDGRRGCCACPRRASAAGRCR